MREMRAVRPDVASATSGRPAATNVTSGEGGTRVGDGVVSGEELTQCCHDLVIGVAAGFVAGEGLPCRHALTKVTLGEAFLAHPVAGVEEPLHLSGLGLQLDLVVKFLVPLDERQDASAEVLDGLGRHRDCRCGVVLEVEPHEEVVVARTDTDSSADGAPDHVGRLHASLVEVQLGQCTQGSRERDTDDHGRSTSPVSTSGVASFSAIHSRTLLLGSHAFICDAKV